MLRHFRTFALGEVRGTSMVDSHIRLEPANPDMEPIIPRHEEVKVLGGVAGLIRHYRRH